MGVITSHFPADNEQISDIMLKVVAEKMQVLGKATGCPDGNPYHVVTASSLVTYRMYPNCRNPRSEPSVIYYDAFNMSTMRSEWVVPPRLFDSFSSNSLVYAMSAANFYSFLASPEDYEVSSVMVGHLAAKGDFKGAIEALGSAWLDALKSPTWWMAAVGGHAPHSAKNTKGKAPKPAAKLPPVNPTKKLTTTLGNFKEKLKAKMKIPEAQPVQGVGISMPENTALNRLKTTAANLQNLKVDRTMIVLDRPMVYRHTITADIPGVNMARIMKEQRLRLSVGGRAHYGPGVYAWHQGSSGGSVWIDIEVSAGTAVENLVVHGSGGQQRFVRIVPAEGDYLPVKIKDKSITDEVLAGFAKLVKD